MTLCNSYFECLLSRVTFDIKKTNNKYIRKFLIKVIYLFDYFSYTNNKKSQIPDLFL